MFIGYCTVLIIVRFQPPPTIKICVVPFIFSLTCHNGSWICALRPYYSTGESEHQNVNPNFLGYCHLKVYGTYYPGFYYFVFYNYFGTSFNICDRVVMTPIPANVCTTLWMITIGSYDFYVNNRVSTRNKIKIWW